MSILQKFDLGADKAKTLCELARLAETAERYEDMCAFMKELVAVSGGKLDTEQRNLLSVAYKNVISARRAAWRTINQEVDSRDGAVAMSADDVKTYKGRVEKELSDVCNEIIGALTKSLIPAAENSEATVFYKKMTGDYYRYLSEHTQDKAHKDAANKYYSEATSDAVKGDLPATHPIRLGLALNYSVCCYEILDDKKRACELAKKAFDDAISKLDQLDEASYKDSTLIMQLLRDNLTLWTSDEAADEDA